MDNPREFKLISQKFNVPYKFTYNSWKTRQSVVLREQIDSEKFVYGEVAPIPGFPNQQSIKNILHEAKIWEEHRILPNSCSLLPAMSCMKSEIWKESDEQNFDEVRRSILLNSTDSKSKSCSVKRKIGRLPAKEEIKTIKEWLRTLKVSYQVRLDANGLLTKDELKRWSDEMSTETQIQFLEQPLDDKLRDELFAFAEHSSIPLAIDETIVAMGDPFTALEKGWDGFFVIKPTLLNNWESTLEFAKQNPYKTVFSTAFESPFGYEALIRACKFSKLEAGITRTAFSKLNSELCCHHVENLTSPSASASQLSELWNKMN